MLGDGNALPDMVAWVRIQCFVQNIEVLELAKSLLLFRGKCVHPMLGRMWVEIGKRAFEFNVFDGIGLESI
jgi:hypothetical protein